MAFDTLRFSKHLQKAGMERQLADAMAEAQSQAWSNLEASHFSTKADVIRIEKELQQCARKDDLLKLEQRIDRKLDEKLKRFATKQELTDFREDVDRRFVQVDRRFEQVDQRFEQVDQRFEQVDQRFRQVDKRFDQLDKRLEQFDQRFLQLDQRFAHFDQRFSQFGRNLGLGFAGIGILISVLHFVS